MTHKKWGLYNYDNLFGVFDRRREAIYYAEKYILSEPWARARRKGYLSIRRVIVTREERGVDG